MQIKLILYIFFTFLSLFDFSGINYDGFIKKGKVIEAKVLVMVLSFGFGYLLTNFVIDFINL